MLTVHGKVERKGNFPNWTSEQELLLLVLGRSGVQILAQNMAVKKEILRDISKFLNVNVTPGRVVTPSLLPFSAATVQIGPRHLTAIFLDHTQLGLL